MLKKSYFFYIRRKKRNKIKIRKKTRPGFKLFLHRGGKYIWYLLGIGAYLFNIQYQFSVT
jgi:hypothetical protein